jgi:hypothetical protein
MIVFNTLAKATHYVKHKNAQFLTYRNSPHYDSEQYEYHYVNNKRVLKNFGWTCGCGCGKGSSDTTVIGKIKLTSK